MDIQTIPSAEICLPVGNDVESTSGQFGCDWFLDVYTALLGKCVPNHWRVSRPSNSQRRLLGSSNCVCVATPIGSDASALGPYFVGVCTRV